MTSAAQLPRLIQGGMGVGVSSWQLARSVSRAGQLGVVSGTALDLVLARRLQDGDPGGNVRRAIAAFPDPTIAARVLDRYFLPGGRPAGRSYRPVPKLTLRQTQEAQELAVVANFVEVWLARQGHTGVVGINYLEKVQMATPTAALGAILAGVDVVLMGAGVPREIPALLSDLAAGHVGSVSVDVHGGEGEYRVQVDPVGLLGQALPRLRRPQFLAIISATALASYLARDPSTRPDGFVIETHQAGGYNAPPRGRPVESGAGEPVYGPRDEVDLTKVAALGLPFWLAGGYGTPQRIHDAVTAGARGVQVGTLFALARESSLRPDLRAQLHQQLDADRLEVRTDLRASPTGFPFKTAHLSGTLSDPSVYAGRTRVCDLGYLRTPYRTSSGGIGYRCPGEPTRTYQRKGGDLAETMGRTCLCNALTATVGLGQTRSNGYVEPPLVTHGTDQTGAHELAARHPNGWTATDVIDWLLDTNP